MSVVVLTWVFQHSASRRVDRLVLLAIADAAADDGRDAWPSVATLGRKAGVDERTVQRSVARLVELGELEVAERAGRNGSNVYRVVMDPRHSATPPGTAPPRQTVTPADSHPGSVPPPNGDESTQTTPADSHPGSVPPKPRT